MSFPKWSKWILGLLYSCILFVIAQIAPPIFSDFYNYKVKKRLFKTETTAIGELYPVSTTTLLPLNNYGQNTNYYEITSFMIVNTGKELDKDAKIKIEAKGDIIGITPDTLKDKLEIQNDDPSHAFLRIGGLEPAVELEGEIHFFAKLPNDRNKSPIGFDSAGNYKLIIKGEPK